MSKSTTAKAEDTSNTPNSVNETHKEKSTLVDRIPISGTPFWQIKTEDGYFAVMAENIITPVFKTEEELDKYFLENMWNIVTLTTLLLIDKKQDPKPKQQQQVEMDVKSGL